MILGTVELGLNYGINNSLGKPTKKQAFGVLDTAVAYGDSEEIIGAYQEKTGHQFLIDTKLPKDVDNYEASLRASRERLKSEHLNILYMHSFEQCKKNTILEFLQKQKIAGLIKHIGVSIYEPAEMQYIVDKPSCIDVIQFPFSILDNYRWQEQIRRSKEAGVLLYIRSIFLQGLIFKPIKDAFVQSIGVAKFIEAIAEIARANNISIAELAYSYVRQISEIDEILVGCQTADDVIVNANMINTHLSKKIMEELSSISEKIPNTIIDPRKWKEKL